MSVQLTHHPLMPLEVTEHHIQPGWTWCEAVDWAGVRGWGGPAHGSPARWDWGATAYTLAQAFDVESRVDQMLRQMSPQERASTTRDEVRKAVRR